MSLRFRSASQQPGLLPPTDETRLPRFGSEHLKRLARLWVVKDANTIIWVWLSWPRSQVQKRLSWRCSG